MRSRLLASLGFALVLGIAPLAAMAQALQPLDRIVAVVNEDAIMQSELDQRIDQARRQLQQRGIEAPSERSLRDQVLERMIVEEIQLQMAKEANLSVDDTELNRTVRGIAEQNGMSLDQFADTLEADGMSLAAVREDVRREMLIRQIQQRRVASRINISEREVDRYLQQGGTDASYHLAQILVALPQSPSTAQVEAARDKIERLRREVEQGADFAAVAAAESDGSQALNGGDLGVRRAGDIPTIFADTVPNLRVGEVSQPIRSPSGFHLVKLLDRQGGQSISGEAQRDQVRNTLFQRKANDELEAWIQEIRAGAYIDNRLTGNG